MSYECFFLPFFSRRVPGDAQLMLPRSNPIDESERTEN